MIWKFDIVLYIYPVEQLTHETYITYLSAHHLRKLSHFGWIHAPAVCVAGADRMGFHAIGNDQIGGRKQYSSKILNNNCCMTQERNKVQQFFDKWHNHPFGWRLSVIAIVVTGIFGTAKAIDEILTIWGKYNRNISSFPPIEPVNPFVKPTTSANDSALISAVVNKSGVEKSSVSTHSISNFNKRSKSIDVILTMQNHINNCLNYKNKSCIDEILKNNFTTNYVCYVRTEISIYEKRINFFRLILPIKSIKIDSIKNDSNDLIHAIWLKSTAL